MPTKKRTTKGKTTASKRAGKPSDEREGTARAAVALVARESRDLVQETAGDAQKAVNSARDLACDAVIAGTYLVERTLDRLFDLLDRV